MASELRTAFSGLVFGALCCLAPSSTAACSRDGSQGRGEGAVTAPQGGQGGQGGGQGSDCGHSACGSNFFVDAAQPGDCTAGANCTVTFTLVPTGEFHINDDYPYKFRADEAAHVIFQGTDPAGPKVFSKAANNWQKIGPQKGAMTVVFQSADKGSKTIAGVFKLSVCSASSCQLEQTSVSIAANVR